MQENFRGFTFVDDSIINQNMRKLDLDRMDEDEYDRKSSYDDSERSRRGDISDEDDDDDDDLMIPGSSGRGKGKRMSEVEEPLFEM